MRCDGCGANWPWEDHRTWCGPKRSQRTAEGHRPIKHGLKPPKGSHGHTFPDRAIGLFVAFALFYILTHVLVFLLR